VPTAQLAADKQQQEADKEERCAASTVRTGSASNCTAASSSSTLPLKVVFHGAYTSDRGLQQGKTAAVCLYANSSLLQLQSMSEHKDLSAGYPEAGVVMID
jgi:hypothetical protein